MVDDAQTVNEHLKNEWIHLLLESQKKIQHCVNQLSNEQIWQRPGASLNSVGNLILHISGNLRQWVICGVGGQQDQRDRDAEFTAESGETQELLATMNSTIDEAGTVIDKMTEESFLSQHTIQRFSVTSLGAVMHSVPHFVGHTHQIIFITRLILGDKYQFQWSPSTDRECVPI